MGRTRVRLTVGKIIIFIKNMFPQYYASLLGALLKGRYRPPYDRHGSEYSTEAAPTFKIKSGSTRYYLSRGPVEIAEAPGDRPTSITKTLARARSTAKLRIHWSRDGCLRSFTHLFSLDGDGVPNR